MRSCTLPGHESAPRRSITLYQRTCSGHKTSPGLRHDRVLSVRRSLDKYASSACRLAVDVHDGRNGDDAISRPNKRAPTRRSAPSPARRNDREHSLITFNPQHGTRADGPHVLALDGKAGVAGFRDRVRGWNAFRTLHANGAEPAKGLGYPRKIGGIGQRSPSRS